MAKSSRLIINERPKSSFSETIRTVKTNLEFSAIDKNLKVILISSPEPGDGKSFISSNLAAAYAQENKNVLIIDCDLRKGRQHRIFKIKNDPRGGYTNLILNYQSGSTISNYIFHTSMENLDLIPAGPVPPNPVELLSSKNNEEIIERLKKRYDIIILDCPPVLGLSDTLIMTKFSDANIIVTSSHRTKIEVLKEVQRAFLQVNKPITGVLLNKAEVRSIKYERYEE